MDVFPTPGGPTKHRILPAPNWGQWRSWATPEKSGTIHTKTHCEGWANSFFQTPWKPILSNELKTPVTRILGMLETNAAKIATRMDLGRTLHRTTQHTHSDELSDSVLWTLHGRLFNTLQFWSIWRKFRSRFKRLTILKGVEVTNFKHVNSLGISILARGFPSWPVEWKCQSLTFPQVPPCLAQFSDLLWHS